MTLDAQSGGKLESLRTRDGAQEITQLVSAWKNPLRGVRGFF